MLLVTWAKKGKFRKQLFKSRHLLYSVISDFYFKTQNDMEILVGQNTWLACLTCIYISILMSRMT